MIIRNISKRMLSGVIAAMMIIGIIGSIPTMKAEAASKKISVYVLTGSIEKSEIELPTVTYKYEYNAKGLLKQRKRSEEIGDEKRDITIDSFTYDSNNRLQSTSGYIKIINGKTEIPKSSWRNEYEYNKKGQIIKSIQTNKKEGNNSITAYRYDKKGRVKGITTYEVDNGTRNKSIEVTYTYNSKGLLSKEKFETDYYNATYNYAYDSNNNVKKQIVLEKGEEGDTTIVKTYKNTYDKNNLLIKRVCKQDGVKTLTITYTYEKMKVSKEAKKRLEDYRNSLIS